MKLKYTFETMELDDHVVAIPVGESAQTFRGVIKLNDSAAEIFELFRENISEEEVICALRKRYGEDPEINDYVHCFITQLRDEGVVE